MSLLWFMMLNFPAHKWQVRKVIPATRNKSTLQQMWGVCLAITRVFRLNPHSAQEQECQLLFSGWNFMSEFHEYLWCDCQGCLWTKKEFDKESKAKICQKRKRHPFLSFTISVLELSKCVFQLALLVSRDSDQPPTSIHISSQQTRVHLI